MNKNKIKRCTKYLRENCDEFIKSVHQLMFKTNWQWWCSNKICIPSQKKIKNYFFELLDDIEKKDNVTHLASGGFGIFINEDCECIECYFGRDSDNKKGISLVSEVTEDDVNIVKFIDKLCEECPILNKEYILKHYKEFKKFIN